MNQGKISVRNFLFDDEDRIYRLPLSKSVAMMRDPEANPCPQFAGKRVRSAEMFVELSGGYPVRVTRMIYYVLTFDEQVNLTVSQCGRLTLPMALLCGQPLKFRVKIGPHSSRQMPGR